ncbi:MAG: protein kinase [Gemmatimonadales bacterium]
MDTPALARLNAALAGRYRIERELGQGGMATVYLAHDEKHDRKVAIKVLHEDLGATLGPERFLAEIKTTAKLQHPHVLPLLDSGSTDAGDGKGGLLFYVMPFVEGESLRDRLDREKQLPIDDALRIAREVGDALGMAHGHGIIHRDIKPENILLQGGHALVADFGIALAVQHAGGARLTQTGLSLGTPQYMSPEQAMGEKSVDARADVYALGAVTYEMLVGEPPFTGATVQAIVAKVLSSEPEPPTTMRKTIPAHVEDAVLTALAKLPADRFATVSAFTAALDGAPASGSRTQATRAGSRAIAGRGRARTVAGAALGVFVGVAIGWFAWRDPSRATSGDVSRAYIRLPAAEVLPEGTTDFVLSPNGEDLVYVGPGEQPGTTHLWRKRRSGLHATRIAATAGAAFPFFSPDGKWIAYATPKGLMKVPLDGGTPATVSEEFSVPLGRGAWMPDGRIVGLGRTWLGVVSSDGGKVDRVASANQLAGNNPHRIVPLPGEKLVLVQACPPGCSRAVIYVVDLAAKSARRIIEDGRSPAYLPTGQLVWIAASGQVMVAGIDARTGTLSSAPRAVIEGASELNVAASGRLVYREGDVGAAIRAVWVDRAGKPTPIDPQWVAQLSSEALSPDGKRLVVSLVARGEQQLWIKELPAGPLTKFTLDPGDHFRPTWSADGQLVRFIHARDTSFELVEKNANGNGEARRVPYGNHQIVDATPSRDGKWLAMRTGAQDSSYSVLALRIGVDPVAKILPSGPGAKLGVALSPDARFIAYQSAVSGNPEVYVSPFPDVASARWQVSRSGGLEPRWAANGRELFYVTREDVLTVATYTASPSFSVTSTKVLFDVGGYARDGGYHMYDLTSDDQRFLMLKRETFPGELVVVDGWFTELREKLKAAR